MMTDYFGNELHIGDEVAFNDSNRGSSSFITGKVERFTNCMVCISYKRHGDQFTNHTKKMPYLLIKNISKQLTYYKLS